VLEHVQKDNKDVRKGDWSNKEIEVINSLHLITAKPVIYLINLSEKDYIRKKNKWLPNIKAAEDRKAREAELGTASILPKVIVSGYQSLQLIYFFTGGPDEVRAWTVRRNTKAPQAAGVIHTDFERGFIMAEVMKYADLKELGSEGAVKSSGKYMQKGRDYVVDDGDIIFFKFNVTAPKKK
ncbi:hypothetical protein SYNPS1DRAFT_23846, partial [Syncephalis pseudoplumigaleata]